MVSYKSQFLDVLTIIICISKKLLKFTLMSKYKNVLFSVRHQYRWRRYLRKMAILQHVTLFCFGAESIMAFAWEPVGHKFAVIHGESPRICVSVYSIIKGGNVELTSKCSKTPPDLLICHRKHQTLSTGTMYDK